MVVFSRCHGETWDSQRTEALLPEPKPGAKAAPSVCARQSTPVGDSRGMCPATGVSEVQQEQRCTHGSDGDGS